MKRMVIFSWCIIFVLASMVFVSYGERQKIAISKANLSDLKGNWVGSRTTGLGDQRNTDLIISNDSLPLECKFTLYDFENIQGRGKTKTLDRDLKGKINDQGNLLVGAGNVEVELSLYDDGGKKKLEGNYSWGGRKGTMSLKKK
jgi:hypothetical protein